MDKSGVFVGGAIGAVMTMVIVAILFISPPELVKPDIKNDNTGIVAEASQLDSKKLSLIEIFEKSEPGVVRVNVQRG